MPLRYFICGEQLSCEDYNIVGELTSTPEKNQEYVYKDRSSGKVVKTGKKITKILNASYQNADLHLVLDDNSIINLIIL